MALEFFHEKRPHNGLTYDEYKTYFEQQSEVESSLQDYMKLNLQRSNRIEKTYQVSSDICEAIGHIQEPQLWMIITEPWCGDSAQCLPYLAKIAECNDQITLRILLRDQNIDIMDQYLTNGKRGVPKLVAFSETGEEHFRWGPRPKPAQKLFDDGIAAGKEKKDIYPEMHKWYAKDKGQALEREILDLLQQFVG